MHLLKKISEELNVIPEIKNVIQPLSDAGSVLLKAEERNDEVGKLKKEYVEKMKYFFGFYWVLFTDESFY